MNVQQIPSHGDDMRMMFKASTEYKNIDAFTYNNAPLYIVSEIDEVLTPQGWKRIKDLVVGDIVCGDDFKIAIKDIKKNEEFYYLYV